MGNSLSNRRVTSGDDFLEGILYCHAENLERIYGVIRKKSLIEFLMRRNSFEDYHMAKIFVLKCIAKAKEQNCIYEATIYTLNIDAEWTYPINCPEEASLLSCAQEFHVSKGFFTKDFLIEKLTDSMGRRMPTSDMIHMVGRVVSTGLKVQWFCQETAFRFKSPLIQTPEPCPSEDFEDISAPSASSCTSDIALLNTCY